MPRAHPFDLSGKVTLITGANSGLGFGFADAIARAGGDVVIWGRREDRNAEAAERLRAHGVRVETDTVDVSDETAQLRGFARALAAMGRLDGVIANAGFVTIAPLVDMTLKQYDELQRVAQHGAFITLREGARHMVARAQQAARSLQGREAAAQRGEAERSASPRETEASEGHQKCDRGGSLIATGSLTNFTATPGIGHYAAAKNAVAGLIRTFALELGPHQIRANMICAGLTKTEMVPFDDAHPFGQAAIAKIPLGRMAEPDEIGGIAVYLLSDAARYHTGDLITVDGGRMIYGV
jgi:NAD(P)-dependent dehydrogenase (short-subunit alcohol dehydrogenase family)